MNRATRDKFTAGTDQSKLTSGSACWETVPAVFAKLNEDFGPFDIDLTADPARHLCPVWFGPGSAVEQDALSGDWYKHGKSGYSNPPYGRFVARMLAHARGQARAFGFTTTLLLPMRVTIAFREHVISAPSVELWFSDSRLIFWENGAPRLNPKTGKPDAALFDSIIVRFGPSLARGVHVGIWNAPSAQEQSRHVTRAHDDHALRGLSELSDESGAV